MCAKIVDRDANNLRMINQFDTIFRIYNKLSETLSTGVLVDFFSQKIRLINRELLTVFERDVHGGEIDVCYDILERSVQRDEKMSENEFEYYAQVPKELYNIQKELEKLSIGWEYCNNLKNPRRSPIKRKRPGSYKNKSNIF